MLSNNGNNVSGLFVVNTQMPFATSDNKLNVTKNVNIPGDLFCSRQELLRDAYLFEPMDY